MPASAEVSHGGEVKESHVATVSDLQHLMERHRINVPDHSGDPMGMLPASYQSKAKTEIREVHDKSTSALGEAKINERSRWTRLELTTSQLLGTRCKPPRGIGTPCLGTPSLRRDFGSWFRP